MHRPPSARICRPAARWPAARNAPCADRRPPGSRGPPRPSGSGGRYRSRAYRTCCARRHRRSARPVEPDRGRPCRSSWSGRRGCAWRSPWCRRRSPKGPGLSRAARPSRAGRRRTACKPLQQEGAGAMPARLMCLRLAPCATRPRPLPSSPSGLGTPRGTRGGDSRSRRSRHAPRRRRPGSAACRGPAGSRRWGS